MLTKTTSALASLAILMTSAFLYSNCQRVEFNAAASASPPANDKSIHELNRQAAIQKLRNSLIRGKTNNTTTQTALHANAQMKLRGISSIDTESSQTSPQPGPFERSKLQIDFNQLNVQLQSGEASSAPPGPTGPTGVIGKAATQSDLNSASNPISATPLLATINNECVEARDQAIGSRASDQFLSSRISHRHMARRIPDLRIQSFAFSASELPDQITISSAVADDPCLVGLSNNQLMTTEYVSFEPFLGSQPQVNAMHSLDSYDVFYSKSSGVTKDIVFAVIDSGVDYNHEDLRNRMWRDAGGSFGIDIANGDSDPQDDVWHGTFVAGLIAAQGDNRKGMTGTMGMHGLIMAVKVAKPDPMNPSSGQATLGDIANGVRWAVDHGADVLNISMAGPYGSADLQDSIKYAIDHGKVVVMAAGNDGKLIDPTLSTTWIYPAIYAILNDGAISVGNYNVQTNAKSSSSNYGSETVDICAPGDGGVFSTMRNNSYGSAAGTSFSSPIVAAAAGLVIGMLRTNGYNPTPAQIEQMMLLAADKRDNLKTSFVDGNFLDLKMLANFVESLMVINSNGGMRTQF